MSTGPEALVDVDPALADLGRLFDPHWAAERFQREWRVAVATCTPLRARYEPGSRCTVTYDVVLATATTRTIGVVDATPDQLLLRRHDEDDALGGLRAASDPGVVVEQLASLFGSVEACAVELVDYRPESRAMLRYVLATGDGPVVLYGKVLATGAERLARTLAGLHRASQRDHSAPRVAALVAHRDDLGLVVHRDLPGTALDRLAFDDALSQDQRLSGFFAAGRALAWLHHSDSIDSPPRQSAEHDASMLRSYLPVLRHVDGYSAQLFEAAIDFAACAPSRPGHDAAVPSHGSLRTDHVQLSQGTAGLLDLDGYCIAPPARDVGNFCAYLRWRAMRRSQDRAMVAAATDAFLAGYSSAAAPPPDDARRFFEALSLVKIAGRRCRSLSTDEWPLLPDLAETATSLVGAPR